MSTPVTSAAVDQAIFGKGELTTTPWHDVHDNRTSRCTAPRVLIASYDKFAGYRFWPAADTEGRAA